MRYAMSGAVIVMIFVSSAIDAVISQINHNDTRKFPEIKQGEKCVKGQVYKMECNTCHCGANNNLLCTKMACLNSLQKERAPKTGAPNTGAQITCSPGKLYRKGCHNCFCTNNAKLKCNTQKCEQPGKAPPAGLLYTDPEHIKRYAPADFYKLPSLPHQGSECTSGMTYRVDCNTCFCLDSGNLMCQKLLCPSYSDVYQLKAKEMSGKPCSEKVNEECVTCECQSGVHVCSAKPACQHSDGRRMMHGEFPSSDDRNFINLNNMTEKCVAGMVYRVHCNRCYCQDDSSLRCTQKTCLNFSEVQRLKKLRLKLEKEDPEDQTNDS